LNDKERGPFKYWIYKVPYTYISLPLRFN
jgi:hypothetical protein